MKCFYHKSDLDGHCSGAIVKGVHPECEMIGVDYNDKLDRDTIAKGEVIFVVDFSFPVEDMLFLDNMTPLCWIDHHKSAIEKMAGHRPIDGIREVGKAACELTWAWFYPHEVMPDTVRLLGRYDVWDFSDHDTLPFQYGMREHEDTLPDSEMWKDYIRNDYPACFDERVHMGRIILSYQAKQDAIYARGMAYEAVFHGLRAIVMNKAHANSKAFDAVYDPKKHDIMVLFGMKPGEYKYSLFSDKEGLDVSVIAATYGGGGHKGAAGFYSKTQLV